MIIVNKEEDIDKGIIIGITEKDDYQELIIKKHYFSFCQYLMYSDNKDLQVGDEIIFISEKITTNSAQLPNGFDYLRYLRTNMIKGCFQIKEEKVINHYFTIHNLHFLIDKYLKNSFIDYDIIKIFVIGGKNTLDQELKDDIKNLGISHLFVISGLHVGLIISFLSFVFKKLKFKEKIIKKLLSIFLIIYLIINDFSTSILRVTISYFLTNRLKNNHIDPFNIFSLNFIIISSLNPFKVYQTSFILTYLISGFLILSNKLIKNKILSFLFIPLISILVTLPVVSYLNGYLNLFSIAANIIMVPLVSLIITPLCLISAFLPFLNIPFHYLITIFIKILQILSNIKIQFNVPVMPLFFYLLYYYGLYRLFNKWEYLLIANNKNSFYKLIHNVFIIIMLLIIWNNKNIFNLNYKVTFFNVKEGDAILIESPLNHQTILIDTSIDDEIATVLVKKGIKKIDYLFITHSDNDHNGMIKPIGNLIKIKNCLINPFDTVTLNKIQDLPYNINTTTICKNDFIKLGIITIQVLNPEYDYFDSNNNSLCFIMNINNFNFLFTGDIEKEAENEIFNQTYDIDFLKIPHHGSNTSSSYALLRNVKPVLSIAVNGYNMKFNFPSEEVLKRYQEYNLAVYNTRFNKSLEITLYNNKQYKLKSI